MGKLTINASATPQVWKLIKDTISEAERRGPAAQGLRRRRKHQRHLDPGFALLESGRHRAG